MPNPKDSKFVVVQKALVPRIEAKRKAANEMYGIETSFQGLVNDLIKERLDKEDLLKDKFPHLSKIAIQGSVIYIKDAQSDHDFDTFEVYFTDGQLYCEQDGSTNCEHVQFAWALPELGKIAHQKKSVAAE